MAKNITQKIIEQHLAEGAPGQTPEIGIRIDQTLTQDATGTMAYLQFEAMDIPRVRTKLSVSYVDHNTLQTGFENADDHRFLQSIAAKYGIHFSRPGNGICHQVHLERFGVPGQTLVGSDSHTPTAGGIGMLGIGAGGLDVAVAMAGGLFYIPSPKVLNVRLVGKPAPWTSGKDIILELLRRLSVKGGVGRIVEYSGPGLKHLSVPERATITNMGAELGATSSIFPSDERTREFMEAQKRGDQWVPLVADDGATYDETVEIDLAELEPMIAQPHSPDSVVRVSQAAGKPVAQVCIGSCTNSSLRDLTIAAAILKGKHVHPDVSLTVSPGSRQVLLMITRSGVLADLLAAGARLLETACGPCIGMGQAPPSGSSSIRTFNRNFKGRCGTADAGVFLASAEVAAASALTGKITDPRDLGAPPHVHLPRKFDIDDSMILPPSAEPESVEIIRGRNIKALPRKNPLPDSVSGDVLLKTGDNITTDDIMPAGSKVLPLRSNIPAISKYVFSQVDPSFAERAEKAGGGLVVGGGNYGQGSSREHAALAPMYLGVSMVLVKSFARIHRANLINFGIVPAIINEADYDALHQGMRLRVPNLRSAIENRQPIEIVDESSGTTFTAQLDLTEREAKILLAGGLLNYTKASS
ncbi:MAG TPA: aconitate hydratase [Planctomycetota bacterium]|nr:aconitate hydratase [Planctomycetota bacterium]